MLVGFGLPANFNSSMITPLCFTIIANLRWWRNERKSEFISLISVEKKLYWKLDLFEDWWRTRNGFWYLELGNFRIDLELFSIADEWENFLERIGRGASTGDAELQESSSDSLELRFWASYRGQTLARTGNKFLAYILFVFLYVSIGHNLRHDYCISTSIGSLITPSLWCFFIPLLFGFAVRGMMYYRRALMLQSFLESRSLGGSCIWTFCIAVCDSDFHSNEVWHGYLLAICCVNSGQLFSKQLHYKSRFWIISWSTGTGRFEVYLCCIMPNLWSTKAAKGTRSCWYCFIVTEVSICVLIIFKCIHDNILCMGTHIVYLKMCFQEASGHWTS